MSNRADNQHRSEDDPGPRLPPRPEPEPCCGSGCDPCVLELYEEALERWERQVAEIKNRYYGRDG